MERTLRSQIIKLNSIRERFKSTSEWPDSKQKRVTLKFISDSMDHYIRNLEKYLRGEYIKVNLNVDGEDREATFVNIPNNEIQDLYHFLSQVTGKDYKVVNITRIPTILEI